MTPRVVSRGERFARWVFVIAGVYGLAVLTPQYFIETKIGVDDPPAITHVEYFYGFIGVALAWQIAFLIIATDPRRFRPLMLAAVVEKASFAIAASLLFAQGRLNPMLFAAGMIDLCLGLAFFASFIATKERPAAATDGSIE